MRALQHFPTLQDRHIKVKMRDTGGSTMHARPRLNIHFFNRPKRQFIIGINPVIRVDEKTRIEEIPREVLVGWFAHELGHVMDYLNRSGWDLLRFGVLYKISENFRIGAERKADLFAMENGCASYIMETKKFIIEHSDLSNVYKAQIERYYISPEELTIILEEQTNIRIDDADIFK